MRRFPILLILISAVVPVFGQTIFSIDENLVDAEEFKYVYSKNSFNNEEAFSKRDLKEYLELYINFKLKVHEARMDGLDTLPQLIDEFASYKEQLKKPYLADQNILDQQVQEAYDRLKYELNASHILMQCAPNASPEDTLEVYNRLISIKKRIESGEPFESLARKFSEDPSARQNGGDLGYFTSMQMVYPFESAAYNTPAGTVSNPVRTRFGYHLIHVKDKRRSVGKVQVAHIMVRFNRNMDAADSARAREKIFEISNQLKEGSDWDEMCQLYSEDPSTKPNGGLIRPFGPGVMPFEFQEKAFSMENEGQISEPFTTAFGWHIIKMVKIIGIESLQQMEPTIRARINSDGRAQLQRKALIKRLKEENGFKVNAEAERALLDEGDQADSDMVLLEIGDRQIEVTEYIEAARPYTLQELQAFYDSKVIEYEESILTEKYPEYGFLLNEYWEGILLFQIMDEKVWSKAAEDTLGLAKFYESNKSSYQWKERIDGLLFESRDKKTIDSVANFLRENPELSMDSIRVIFSDYSDLKLKITNGPFEKGHEALPPSGDIKTGIIEYKKGDVFSLLLGLQILPASTKKLEEIKGLVISDYQDKLDKDWIQELRTKYNVDRNKKNIRKVFKELAK